MSTQVEQIIEGLSQRKVTLEAACNSLAQATTAHPGVARFWVARIESAIKDKRIGAADGRALIDSMDNLRTDKTMWLEPAPAKVAARSIGPAVTANADAPKTEAPAKRPEGRRSRLAKSMDDLEQLRAALFDPKTRPRSSRSTGIVPGPAESNTTNWMDDSRPPDHVSDLHPANPLNLAKGTLLKDRYELVEHLGAGGIGQVFDAIDRFSGYGNEQHVTIKVVAVDLRHQPDAFASLQRAVSQTQHLNHPNIVRVNEIDREGDRVFIVMEPLRGRWLSGLIREVRGQGMPYAEAWPIVSGIAKALAYAHAEGVVHSDLSPHAVFLSEDGTAKILGFGLIHAVPASNEAMDLLDTLTLRAYTEAYTADAWAQQADPHPTDDLYPLGVIAYEMLTGVHPFGRSTLAVARQRELKFEQIPRLNRRARKLIERCLSFERRGQTPGCNPLR